MAWVIYFQVLRCSGLKWSDSSPPLLWLLSLLSWYPKLNLWSYKVAGSLVLPLYHIPAAFGHRLLKLPLWQLQYRAQYRGRSSGIPFFIISMAQRRVGRQFNHLKWWIQNRSMNPSRFLRNLKCPRKKNNFSQPRGGFARHPASPRSVRGSFVLALWPLSVAVFSTPSQYERLQSENGVRKKGFRSWKSSGVLAIGFQGSTQKTRKSTVAEKWEDFGCLELSDLKLHPSVKVERLQAYMVWHMKLNRCPL